MRSHETASDQVLIDATRGGDRAAFAVLWSRHSAPALSVARTFTSLDADDVVAEAFSRIYAAIRNGAGPTTGFRPYLFTTVRNVASRWGRAPTTVNLDEIHTLDTSVAAESEMLDALDRSTTAQAFRSLPSRWQEVLWYIEVEGMAPREVGVLLGMKPNSISALAVRAREGLRQAWIKTHLASTGTEPECARTIERLPAYARGRLGARPRQQVRDHLATCESCRLVAEEATHVSSRIAVIFLPLTLGAAAAAAYAAALDPAGAVAAAAVASGPSTTGAGSGGGGLGGGSIVTAGVIGGSILVVAGIGVSAALMLGPLLAPPGISDAGAGVVEEPTRSEVTIDPPAPPVPGPVMPESITASEPPTEAESESRPRPRPSPQSPVLAPERPRLPPAHPVPPVAPTPTPGATPTPVTVPAPAVVVRAGPSEVFPDLTGTAEPHAIIALSRIRVSGEPGGPVDEVSAWATVSDSSGTWETTLAGIRPGDSRIVVTQTTTDGSTSPAAAPVPVTLDPPPSLALGEVIPGVLYTISVTGHPGKTIRLEYRGQVSAPLVLDAAGHWDSGGPVLVQEPGDVWVRYVHGDRIGVPGRQ